MTETLKETEKMPESASEVCYRFVGRNSPVPEGFKIPYGVTVTLVRWFPRRKVLVKYNGEKILTMGYLLRKVKASDETHRFGQGQVPQLREYSR